MTCLKFTDPASGPVLALLTLPQPLTSQTWFELESAVTEALNMLGRDLSGAAHAAVPDQRRPYAADAEYASWMSDPGAIEFASWAVHLQSVVTNIPAGTTGCAKSQSR